MTAKKSKNPKKRMCQMHDDRCNYTFGVFPMYSEVMYSPNKKDKTSMVAEDLLRKNGFMGHYIPSNFDPTAKLIWLCKYHLLEWVGLYEIKCFNCNEDFAISIDRYFMNESKPVRCPICCCIVSHFDEVAEYYDMAERNKKEVKT